MESKKRSGLAILLWVLSMLLIINIALILSGKSPFSESRVLGVSSAVSSDGSNFDEFHGSSVDEQIRSSTAIVLAEYVDQGDRLSCRLKKVLKLSDGASLKESIGEEIRECSHYKNADVVYAGEVVLMYIGLPPEMASQSPVYEGMLPGLERISMDTLLGKIERENVE